MRLRVKVNGIVQGVGFRPFAQRLAHQLGLGGWVANTPEGAVLEVEGPSSTVESFLRRLTTDAPASALVDRMTTQAVPAAGETSFSIRLSSGAGLRRIAVPPDLAMCAECAREMGDPGDRRFRYPFLTCTRCGPRFSIITGIPYDRPRTTMSRFPLCSACEAEYGDETNRRFHAEPIACPVCGPHLTLWDEHGITLASSETALQQACGIIKGGEILAVKGLGGFQLWVDARSESAVQRLRARKRRPHKPFAVLFPSLASLQATCSVSDEEATLLASPQAPIVLVCRSSDAQLSPAVAPDNPFVGAMLPYTPLHQLLMAELQCPVVATSGNRSDEPISIDEQDALARLAGIADAFLVHNRPIARPVDDSVVRVVDGKTQTLRRARGYAPSSIRLNDELRQGRLLAPTLAVGGHLKNTVALAYGEEVVLSQHLGDLSTAEAFAAFRRAIEDLQQLLVLKPQVLACDLHPDYRSTIFAHELARSLAVPLVSVQHHHAHVAACMAEHGLAGKVLGVAWDGLGYGPDGTVWGGEFLVAGYEGFRRLGHLLPFRLPGGDRAAHEPRRSALSLLWQTWGEKGLTGDLPHHRSLWRERESLVAILRKGIAAPFTTSVGRLFDAVASLTGLCQVSSFEGQAGMALEFAAERFRKSNGADETGYTIPLLDHGTERSGWQGRWVADWRPMVHAIVKDVMEGSPPERTASKFHHALADLIGQAAEVIALPRVVLTGGVFQNALLVYLTRRRLEKAGFLVYTHCRVPPNDGGLALGQAMVAAHRLPEGKREN